ncbi:MAG: hypothetical protein ACE5FQ_03950, partial [Thiogranum sp.]
RNESCRVHVHGDRVANPDDGLLNIRKYIRKISRVMLCLMLPWNAYAAADRFPGVADELAGMSVLADGQESRAGDALPQKAEIAVAGDVGSGVPALQGKEQASLDVVDTGVLKKIRSSQPAPVKPWDTAALEIVDTGVSRQVQNPQPVETASPGVETEAAVVPETAGLKAGVPDEAGELNTDSALAGDRQASNYKVMRPIDVAGKNEAAEAVVAEAGKDNRQSEYAVGGDVASEESIHLPYAILLAILALMSMIPVARRNG